ncbi:MAG: FecR domain-containing protein, partial [Rhodoferax sp.]|nr:FecR domain-containing protein [Rhodoferax sp.]
MPMQTLRLRALTFVAGAAFLLFSGWANADPPARVARLGYASGAVSFSAAGDTDWDRATINRPLTNGDRLWTDAGARAEIQVGGAMIRMNAGTSVSVLNLDDRIAQLQLTQGTLNVRVRRLEPGQVFEVDTPNLAFTLRQPGEYRITVDPDGNATDIIVRKGQGEVYGEGAAYVVDSRQPYRFKGTGLREYEYLDVPPLDEFDLWALDRDRRYDNSPSARYVSPDVVGYQDLDANGNWRENATYGRVWVPRRVAAGWAPYRDGHWVWVNPWGWTWVDDAPWGFAVSHYGRWANLGGTWCWVPGPTRTRAYYAPALVAFVGDNNFQLTISSGNVGGVAWFPLAPREVYRPAYTVSRGYFEKVNRSNTVINNTVIHNTYNTTNVTNVIYANRQVPGAVIAVPRAAFVQSQSVSKAAVRVPREVLARTPVAVIAPTAPTERRVRESTGPGGKPPARVFERSVVARSAPPAVHVGFAAQQAQPGAKPGKPIEEADRKENKPAAPAPSVKVLDPAHLGVPTTRPPPVAPRARSGDARVTPDSKKESAAPAVSVAPPLAAQGAAEPKVIPPQVAPSAPATQGMPKWSAQPKVAPPPPVARPAPAAQPTAKPESIPAARQTEPGPPVAVPRPPPQRAAEPKPVAPQVDPVTQEAPRQSAPHKVAPPPPVARPAPAAPLTAKPEFVPAPRQAEPGPPVAVPRPPPQRAAEPKPVAPQVAPPPAFTAPAAAPRQAEVRAPVAAPRPPPPPPQTHPVPTAQPQQVQNHKPA